MSEASKNVNTTQYPEQIPIPRGRALFSSIGPGLVLAMTFLGTGDLTSSSVSGANYGYALIWTLVISLFARIFIINSLAKYTLMNRYGDTEILQGFGRVAKWLPGLMAVIVLICGFVTQATFLRAAATGLYQFTGGNWGGQWGTFICALVVVGLTLIMILQKKQYKILEVIARVASVIMIIGYIIALVRMGGFHVEKFMRGLLFEMPKGTTGTFAPIVVAASTIGTIAGNMPNLLYSGFMKDKGWVGPKYRNLQKLDLYAGMGPLLLINLLFWIVAVEYTSVYNPDFLINTEMDMAAMMRDLLGGFGPVILWSCIFGAAITSFPAETRGFGQLAVSGIRLIQKDAPKYDIVDNDPIFKKMQVIVFTLLPLVASLPGAPGLVALNLVGTSFSTVLSLPIICIVLLLLTSSKKHMMDYAVNKKWQTVFLIILTIIAFVVGAQIVVNIPDMFKATFGI